MLPGGGAFCKEKGADGRMQPRSWKGDLGPYLPPRVREMLASVDEDAPLEEIRPARRAGRCSCALPAASGSSTPWAAARP